MSYRDNSCSTCHPLLSECLYGWTHLGSEVLPDAFDGDAAVIVGLVKRREVGAKIFSISARSCTVLLFRYMYMREERSTEENIFRRFVIAGHVIDVSQQPGTGFPNACHEGPR